jgi:hypothetical protein
MPVNPFAEDLGPFWTSDTPAGIVLVEFLDADGMVGPRPDATITATLHAPDGLADPAVLTVTADPETESIDVEWTTAPTFAAAGIWSIRLQPATGSRYAPLAFVVQADDGWTTIDDARNEWADAPQSDATLSRLLAAARTACLDFAPALADGAAIPVGYQLAQLMQARAIWNATKTGGGDNLGAEGLTVTVFPLDWNIKALLRPKRGRPVIR